MTWTVVWDNTPTGMALDASTGLLSGTCSTPGVYTGTLTNDTIPVSKTVQLNIFASGKRYVGAVLSGTIPPGLIIDCSGDPVLIGTPTTPGTFVFTASFFDMSGKSASKEFSVTIAPSNPPIIVETTLPDITID